MLAGRAALLAAAALLFVALFFGDGTSDGRLFWIGALALIAAAALRLGGAAAGAARRRRGRLSALLAALTAWVGLTMWWSIAPDRSWEAFNRMLVYGAFALLGLSPRACRGRRGRSPPGSRAPARARARWALLGKVIPSLFPDGARVARLRNPVGYWNCARARRGDRDPARTVASRSGGAPAVARIAARCSSTSRSSSSS